MLSVSTKCSLIINATKSSWIISFSTKYLRYALSEILGIRYESVSTVHQKLFEKKVYPLRISASSYKMDTSYMLGRIKITHCIYESLCRTTTTLMDSDIPRYLVQLGIYITRIIANHARSVHILHPISLALQIVTCMRALKTSKTKPTLQENAQWSCSVSKSSVHRISSTSTLVHCKEASKQIKIQERKFNGSCFIIQRWWRYLFGTMRSSISIFAFVFLVETIGFCF